MSEVRYFKQDFSNSSLKIIAMFSMVIDHVGAAILEHGFTESTINAAFWLQIDLVLRFLGRPAFPIFCFLIVEGYYHTRNRTKYLFRLLILAFISEIPFDLAFRENIWDVSSQNVVFTLVFGLLALLSYEYVIDLHKLYGLIAVAVWAVLAQILHADYGAFGVLLIFILFLYRDQPLKQSVWGALVTIWEITAPLAFLLTYHYNHQRGLSLKWVFYAFYPAHLLFLVWIRILLQ